MKKINSNSYNFKILHLSDAHIGNPELANDADSIFTPLFDDLKKAKDDQGHIPDLIVFSGDLVYGRIKKANLSLQYKKANAFLKSLFNCFDKKMGEIPLFIAPGNHDIDREKINSSQKAFRKALDTDIVLEMMRKKDTFLKTVLENQKQWQSFVKSIPHQNWKWHNDLNLITGTLSTKNGKKVGVAIFNTSWLSQDEYDNGQIWLGKEQFDIAIKEIKSCNLKIAVAHHPTEWLHANERTDLSHKIQSHFQIFFHGHEHSQWFLDSNRHLMVCAGACYDRKNEDKCYSWLLLNLNNQHAKICLRKYIDEGKGGWSAYCIPEKTNTDGEADLIFLNSKVLQSEQKEEVISDYKQKPEIVTPGPGSLTKFVKKLQDFFFVRWEGLDLNSSMESPIVYWPVRLRQPTPIHAAQCFIAAGLQKHGCKISLWIDDLGRTEYSPEIFSRRLIQWFERAGGDKDKLNIRHFTEILNSEGNHIEPAWDMLQKWLGTLVYYTDHILKVSKIWPTIEEPSKEEPARVLGEFKKRRPRRLMTPAMVWTCLKIMNNEDTKYPIITLGGYDEKGLWDAWRKCCVFPEMQVGHLYISKLTHIRSDIEQAVHMSDNPLAWESKEDIEKELSSGLVEKSLGNDFSDGHSIIPWTINNCVLLPNFVMGKEDPLKILNTPILTLDDFAELKSKDIRSDLVEAVCSWLL